MSDQPETDSEICMFCALMGDLNHPARIADFPHSVGFLNVDQHYRGRSVLILRSHHEHLHELPQTLACGLQQDALRLGCAIRLTLGPVRLNYSVLGNIVPHIHWHIIPRYAGEPNLNSAPWPTPNPVQLDAEEYRALAAKIRCALSQS